MVCNNMSIENKIEAYLLKFENPDTQKNQRSILKRYAENKTEFIDANKDRKSILSVITNFEKFNSQYSESQLSSAEFELQIQEKEIARKRKQIQSELAEKVESEKLQSILQQFEIESEFEKIPIPENFLEIIADDFKVESSKQIEGNNFEEFVKLARTEKNIILQGPAGVAKTESVIKLAHTLNALVIKVSCRSSIEFEELFYKQTLVIENNEQKLKLIAGPICKAIFLANQGHKVFLVLDEINALDQQYQVFLHGLTDDTKFASFDHFKLQIAKNANIWFVGTMNVGYSATNDLTTPLTDRFVFQTFADIDLATLKKVITGIEEAEIYSIFKLRTKYYDQIQQDNISAKIEFSVRTIQKYANLRKTFTQRQALDLCLTNKIADPKDQQKIRELVEAQFPL